MKLEITPQEITTVVSGDESITFFNPMYQETYHSKSGAIEESLKKFVLPSGIIELAKTGSVKILDVCFGIGYNTGVAIDVILNANPDCKIEIVGFEIDTEILTKIQELHPNIKSYGLIKTIKFESITNNNRNNKNNNNTKSYETKQGRVCLKLLLGDVRKTIKTMPITKEISIKQYEGYFDICFLDPFSPKKCHELWTEEFLKDISFLLKKQGVLTTYSCARVVRDNLLKAGFSVKDGPSVGRRAPSTIAIRE